MAEQERQRKNKNKKDEKIKTNQKNTGNTMLGKLNYEIRIQVPQRMTLKPKCRNQLHEINVGS